MYWTYEILLNPSTQPLLFWELIKTYKLWSVSHFQCFFNFWSRANFCHLYNNTWIWKNFQNFLIFLKFIAMNKLYLKKVIFRIDKILYNSSCPSVGRLVGRSVCWSVGRSVIQLVGWSVRLSLYRNPNY